MVLAAEAGVLRGTVHAASSVQAWERGGRGAGERERGELFKEQDSVSFLSWNNYNASIFIVCNELAHQSI